MTIAPRTQFHVERPWGQRPFSIGSRGLLRDCTTSPINRFAALLGSDHSGGISSRAGLGWAGQHCDVDYHQLWPWWIVGAPPRQSGCIMYHACTGAPASTVTTSTGASVQRHVPQHFTISLIHINPLLLVGRYINMDPSPSGLLIPWS